jgi:hypothetical protein
LAGSRSFILREGNGPEPLSAQPEMTWADIWNYWNALFDMLIAIARSDQSALAASAQEALPNVLTQYTLFGHITRGLDRFRQVAQECVTKQIPLSVSRLSEALILVQNAINRRQAESAEAEEIMENSKQVISDILGFLEAGDFSMRLMRWVGTWASHEHDEHMEELRALVSEVMDQRHLLTEDLLMWLISEEAKLGMPFFRIVGEQDTDHYWQAQIEELGSSVRGAGAFSSYFFGLGAWDRAFVNHRLNELTAEGNITSRAIIWATSDLPGDPSSTGRVVRLVAEKRVDRVDVEFRMLRYGPWLNTLSVDEYVQLLRVTAGEELEYADIVVNSVVTWLYTHADMNRTLAELAWRCLERVSPNSLEDANNCDNVASKLVEVDIESSFALFEKRLKQLSFATLWNPLSPYTGQMFWPALYKADRRRALWMPLSMAARDSSIRALITSGLLECIDQEIDATRLIEFVGEHIEHTYVVCESIAAGKSGFWPVAFEIFRRYTSNENVKGRLQYAIMRRETPRSVMFGLPGIALQSRLHDVQKVLSERP